MANYLWTSLSLKTLQCHQATVICWQKKGTKTGIHTVFLPPPQKKFKAAGEGHFGSWKQEEELILWFPSQLPVSVSHSSFFRQKKKSDVLFTDWALCPLVLISSECFALRMKAGSLKDLWLLKMSSYLWTLSKYISLRLLTFHQIEVKKKIITVIGISPVASSSHPFPKSCILLFLILLPSWIWFI